MLDLDPWRCPKCGVKGDDACCQWRRDQTGYGDYDGPGYSAPVERTADKVPTATDPETE